MKILITGATGLIGQKMVNYFLNKQCTIHVLTHSKSKNMLFSSDRVKTFFWDTDEQVVDLACFEGVDAIIHLAGATISRRWTPTYKQQIIDSRVNSTKLLLSSIKKLHTHQIQHFVSASAIGIYPNSLSQKYTEDYQGTSNFFLAEVVAQWEQAADLFLTLNIAVTKLRTGLVLDKQGGAFPAMAKPVKYYVGAAFGSGNQIYSWIHVDDLVRMYDFVLQNKLTGVYNAVASTPVSCHFFMHQLAKNMKTKIWLPALPAWLLKGMMGEMSHLVLDGQYVCNDKIKAHQFQFIYDDLDQAISSLL